MPLEVGGSRERGVVAVASYEARRFGVHSARGAPAVGVTDANGRRIGLVTPENVGELMDGASRTARSAASAPWQTIEPSPQ